MRYDAIIAGASFAGLAAASQIKGRVLLIDRKEIGAGQTSACGTFESVIAEWGAQNAVLQSFDRVALHCPDEIIVPLIEPLHTIDYEKFCKILARKTRADFLKAVVFGAKGDIVITSAGEFSSRCIIDCTGWRAVLASSINKNYVHRKKLTFCIETVAEHSDDVMRFFVDERIIQRGAAWIFPIGEKSRIGVGSYAGETRIIPMLKSFIKGMNLEIGELHGNFIPYGLREPVVGNIFVVGDAAGQAIPLTAEGIRKSLYFGKECGRIVQDIIEEKISLARGLEEYRKTVNHSLPDYSLLLRMQNWMLNGGVPAEILKLIRDESAQMALQKAYLSI